MDIKLDRVGLVVSGKNAGRYIKVEEDEYGGGAYYVFITSGDNNFTVFDDWVETRFDLERLFKARKWIIKWLESDDISEFF